MAKLTLNDITTGYNSATLYNANNALIEAALENTLSLDGTTPNQMTASLDLNSNDINNVDQLNASEVTTTTFVLNGQAVTLTTTLTGGLSSDEVTYDAGTLTTKLNNDFPKLADAETISGIWTYSARPVLNAGASVGADLTFGTAGGQDNYIGFDTRDAQDGDPGTKIFWDSTFAGSTYNFGLSRNIQYGAQFGRTGDGVALIGFRTDTLDGLLDLSVWDSAGHAAAGALGNPDLRLRLDSNSFGATLKVSHAGVDTLTIADDVITLGSAVQGINFADTNVVSTDANTLDDYEEGTFTPTLTTSTGDVTLNTSSDTLAYTKIGRLVHIMGRIDLSAISGPAPTGVLTMGNLPFRVGTGTDNSQWNTTPIWCDNVSTITTGFNLKLSGTNNNFAMNISGANDTDAASYMTATTEMHINHWYYTEE